MSSSVRRSSSTGAAGSGRVRAWLAEIGATLALAWPLVLANLAGTALTTIDVILLGRLSPDALAAGALGTNLFHAVAVSGIGLVTAVAPLVAAEHGRGAHRVRDIRRSVRQGLWVAMSISLPALVVLFHGEALLLALGQDAELAAAAGAYLRAIEWALPPTLGFIVLRIFTAALGRPGWGLAVAAFGLPFNFCLAWALIFGAYGAPKLGLVGAGIATTVTATLALAALAIVIVTDRRFRRYHVFGRFWRPDWRRFRTIWRLGLPIAASLAFGVTFFGAAGFAMGIIGVRELAAHTVALQIAALCFMVPLGLSQAATIRVGHAFGSGDPRRVAGAGWAAFWVAAGFTGVSALVLFAIPERLIGLFLDLRLPANEPVLALAVQFLGLAALFQLVDGAQVVGAGMLRGLKDTRAPMLYSALGYWGIGAPMGLGLAFLGHLGGLGIWIGLATGLAVVAVLMIRRWTLRERLGLAPPGPHASR